MAFAWLKGHGTENDFVLLPDADGSVHGALEPAFVAALCDRRRGIGADGVLRVIRTEALRTIDAEATESASEWFMDYRNSDGSVSEMCGNGIRVFAKYLFDERLATSPVTIGTRAGDRVVVDNGNGTYSAEMGVADVGGPSKVANITRGLQTLVDTCRRKAPGATLVVTAMFPRNDNLAVMPEIDRINENLARLADGAKIRFLNVNGRLADANGRLFDGMMNERDKLHPTVKGYQLWADGLKPILTELLGPPAATDQAPPPTGDPSAARPR